jgi:hypothetical protein
MRRARSWLTMAAMLAAGLAPLASGAALTARAAPSSPHMHLDCEYATCAEVANPKEVFGNSYVGHDEPSVTFYSNQPGSGTRMSYDMTLPTDPSANNPTQAGKSYSFQLNGAFWFGLAMCDTQSYPEQVSTCKPGSDQNIVDPAVSPNHPGTAFMEMQFYPPGWVPWPTWAVAIGASACDPTRWCAAMNIFSLSEDPVNGTFQNPTCANQMGIEYVNFAFLTKNGAAHAPANPLASTLDTFTPNPSKDLFMNSGDRLKVSFADTSKGLRVVVNDLTTQATGSMTASADNGFAQIKYDAAGTSCDAIPYNFHPMYSTSSEKTTVIWAAHTYNVSFSDEIGHFENCSGPTPIPATPFGLDAQGNPISCPAGNMEGARTATKPTDGDDNFCFPASEALRIHIAGCTDTNAGFDGLDYQPVWPDGNTRLHPTSFLFSSPLTGKDYDVNYSRAGLEADLPRIEGTCVRSTGAGCTLIPTTDAGTPAAFYPTYSTVAGGSGNGSCLWGYGGALPGTTNDFGRNAEWGSLLLTTYLAFSGHGSTINRYNNFRQIFAQNPCQAQAGN